MGRSTLIRDRIHELGIKAKKSLGQNFLVHEPTIAKIIGAALEGRPESIVEVGPGLGSLTEDLLACGNNLLLIELDAKFAEFWRSRGVDVIEGDALDLRWDELRLPAGSRLVSNLPYQIGSRLVVDVSVSAPAIDSMVLMFQKEVAERMAAAPKSKAYGFLSVIAQTYWKVRRIADVGPSGFQPQPKVSSRVLRFDRRTDGVPDGDFVGFVKRCFTNRRKLLIKNFGGEQDWLIDALKSLGYGDKVRAEEIGVGDYASLYRSRQTRSLGN